MTFNFHLWLCGLIIMRINRSSSEETMCTNSFHYLANVIDTILSENTIRLG